MDGLFISNQTNKKWNINGSGNWAVAANWNAQDYPGGAGDVAIIDDTPGTGGKTVTVDQIIALASLTMATAVNASTVANAAGKKIIFLTLDGSNAVFISNQSTAKTISSPIELQRYLAITINANTLVGFSGVISGNFGMSVDSVGTFELSGINTFAGDITLNSGAFRNSSGNDNRWGNSANRIICAGGIVSILTSNLSTARAFVISAATQFNVITVTMTISGIISGSGGISKTGTNGVLALSGVNTFTGTVTITTGTISVGADNNLGNSSNAVSIGGAAIFEVSATFATSRTITTGANSVISVDSGAVFTINSSLTGASAWQKSGSGTLVLAANYTGAGQVTVNATQGSNGILQITANFTNASASLSIQSAANVECIGSIKAVTFAGNASSYFAGGVNGNPGTATCTALTMQSASNTENKLRIYSTGSTVSTIQVNGNLTLNGQLQLPSSSLNTGIYDIIFWTGTLTNTSFTLGTNNTGKSIAINVDTVNKKVQIIVT
jgi:fibronectin-binding autotransporter adhesin